MDKSNSADSIEVVTPGMEAWESIEIPTDPKFLTELDIKNLKPRIIKAIEGLDKEDYTEFSNIAHHYLKANQVICSEDKSVPDLSDIISEIPDFEAILKENVHDYGIQKKIAAFSIPFVAMAGYFGGAVVAGELAGDVKPQYIVHIISSLGAIAGGLIAGSFDGLLNYFLWEHYDNKIEQQKQEAERIFFKKMEEYLLDNI